MAGCARDTVPASGQRVQAGAVAPADTDHFGAPLPMDARFAGRVVSLNPAATEVIFALSLQRRLVGRSRWDAFPAAAARVPSLGDGIRPNVEAVLAARPSLVILYATAENRAAADALARAGVRTIALRVDRMAEFHALVRVLGRALGDTATAQVVSDSVRRTVDAVRARTRGLARVRVVWPLWDRPLLVVGQGSYLDELLGVAGGDNVFHDLAAPSPPVSMEEVVRRAPDAIVTSARGAERMRQAVGWRAVSAAREGRFIIVADSITGRPSVNLGMAAVALARALHPSVAQTWP
ncbi:MAG: ABC transporter substrate-binding protein [Gemmatimonadetes bacterium]|nr:ABC transporter substrate-binding protein [Gemmatimonadota bacterium]